MDDRATAAFLAVLTATWASPEWTDPQLALWKRDLEHIEADDAQRALEELRKTCRFRPSTAQFYELVSKYRRTRQLEATPALPAVSGVRERVAQRIIALREALKGVNRGHMHSDGREGCPTCSMHDVKAHEGYGVHGVSPSSRGCARCRELEHLAEQALETT
jgi:hypothetical protein